MGHPDPKAVRAHTGPTFSLSVLYPTREPLQSRPLLVGLGSSSRGSCAVWGFSRAFSGGCLCMPCLHASPTPGCCLRRGSDHRPVHPCLCLSSLCLTACASPAVPTLTGLWFKQTRRAQLAAHLPPLPLPLQPVPEADPGGCLVTLNCPNRK